MNPNSRPYGIAEEVTPSDTVDLNAVSSAIYVGATGDMAVVMTDGTVIDFQSIPAGTLLPIRVQRVNSTDTTASQIVALR